MPGTENGARIKQSNALIKTIYNLFKEITFIAMLLKIRGRDSSTVRAIAVMDE